MNFGLSLTIPIGIAAAACVVLVATGHQAAQAEGILSTASQVHVSENNELKDILEETTRETARRERLGNKLGALFEEARAETDSLRETHAEVARIQRRLLLPVPNAENRTIRSLLIAGTTYSWRIGPLPSRDGLEQLSRSLQFQGFSVETLVDPTQSELLDSLNSFSNSGESNEVGFVYFSGLSNVGSDGEVRFAPADAKEDATSWLPMSILASHLEDTPFSGTILFFDNVENLRNIDTKRLAPLAGEIGFGFSPLEPPRFAQAFAAHLEDAGRPNRAGADYSTYRMVDLLTATSERLSHPISLSAWTFDDVVRFY